MHHSSHEYFYGLLLRSVSLKFPDLVDRLNLGQGLPKPISCQKWEARNRSNRPNSNSSLPSH